MGTMTGSGSVTVSVRVYGIVVAGGLGIRAGVKKQFEPLAGQAMWIRSVNSLFAGGVDALCVVAPVVDVPRIERDAAELWGLKARVTAGGGTRHESVECGLAAIQDWVSTDVSPVLVAVHDAARPFVSPDDVQRVVAAASECGAALLVQPCSDTVKWSEQGALVERTIPRQSLWLAQTPQVFQSDWMAAAYTAWREQRGADTPTDDAEVLESAGYQVRLVPAQQMNLKVTTPLDLKYAGWLSEQRWGEANHADWTRV